MKNVEDKKKKMATKMKGEFFKGKMPKKGASEAVKAKRTLGSTGNNEGEHMMGDNYTERNRS